MDSMDVLDVAMERLQGAKRYDRYVAAICPFHDDNKPSMLVFADGFRCTACPAHGSIDYLFKHLSIRSIVPQASKPGYYPTIPPDMDNERLVRSANRTLLNTPGLQQYLIGRKVERAIARYDLGYWEGWYTIPIKDEDGKVCQVMFRAGPWIQRETGERFYQRPGQKISLFVPDWELLSSQPKVLFLTFGLFDAITLSLLKYASCSATVGKSSFNPNWIHFWNGPIVICPDFEEEPEAYKLASQLGWRGHVWLPKYPAGCKDPNDLYQHDPEYLQRSLDELECRFTSRFRRSAGGALFPKTHTRPMQLLR